MKKTLGCLIALFVFLNSEFSLAQYQFQRTKLTEISFYDFQELVEESKTVESALGRIHEVYPELFDLYLLSYHSRSLQGSSPMSPRAIVFDPSGQFVMSFNGETSQRGGNAFEIMRFLPEQRRFEFREVVFSGQGGAQVSEANPKKCMVCHQSLERKVDDPRPNWEPYNFWPGFYGSVDGFLGVKRSRLRKPEVRNDDLLVAGIEAEEANLAKFFEEVKPTHSRYKFLGDFERRLTVDFTELMASLNFSRIHRLITEDHADVYQKLEPTFLGVLKCGRMMISAEDQAWIRQNSNGREPIYRDRRRSDEPKPTLDGVRTQLMQDQFAVTELSDEEFDAFVRGQYERQLQEYYDYKKIDISEGLFDLFETVGISTSDWSMDFRTQGRFAAVERFGTPSNTRAGFKNAIREHMTPKRFNALPGCDDLRSSSPLAFSAFRHSELARDLLEKKAVKLSQGEAPLMRRCQRCHDGADREVPYLPFHDENQLKLALDRPTRMGAASLRAVIKRRISIHETDNVRMP
ncbi:MAG: hypothetical protein HRT45_12730, partial [Bdellovibrionales bacterium]|nr:hypothetical protein [Bdellovibrionales bacterium]